MANVRIPKYRNHVLTAINAAKFCIESFNRVDGQHNQQASLIFNAQAWELLSKGFLIRKKENIYFKSHESITAEKAINKLLFVYKTITKEEASTILQVISLRNEAMHGILPRIDDEIITHILFFSLKSFNSFLKRNFKTYSIDFDRNYLSISFKEHTFYSHKITKLFSKSKRFSTKENRILYLLDRGCRFADNQGAKRMESYETWKNNITKKARGSRIACHLSIYKYINTQEDVRFIPVEVSRGHRPAIKIEKTNDPLARVLVSKTDPNVDYPYFTTDIADKLSKNVSFISKAFKKLKIKDDKKYSMLIKINKIGNGIPKYNDKALNYLKDYLNKHQDFNPYK